MLAAMIYLERQGRIAADPDGEYRLA
jgi:hypothetical protein